LQAALLRLMPRANTHHMSTLTRITRQFTRRPGEGVVMALMWASAAFAVLVTAAIVYSVVSEALQFFRHVNFFDFLFGTQWSPQTAMRADQTGASGSFGALPLLAGTFLITLIALLVAVPVGLMGAIYRNMRAHACDAQ
jgi:phosphate transport system permease protein